ncbi:MAG: cupin-like domain-containing protein [Planctomycetota bacterium]
MTLTELPHSASSQAAFADPDQHVPRVERPTAEDFQRRFVQRSQPCVITGVASQWPAFSKWGADYLKSVAGDREVAVHFDEDGDFQRWYSPLGTGDRKMRLADFLDILTAEPPDRRYYMSEHDVRWISGALLADVDMSGYPFIDVSEPAMFLGRDTMMPLHYHGTTEAVCCQLIGDKEFVLFAPEDTRRLAPFPCWSRFFHFSQIGVAEQAKVFQRGDHLGEWKATSKEFPRYAKATPIRVHLRPGDMLYIPVDWWHVTTCPGFQANVVWFWRSSFRRWHFPSPGLHTLGHLAAFRLRHGFRKPLDRYARAKS